MNLGSSFVVPADPSRVFDCFLDPDAMRACVPGCTELERVDDTHYRGRLVNEIAHVRFSAGFTAEITEVREPEEVRAVLKGEDHRLGSSIKIDATLALQGTGPRLDGTGAGGRTAIGRRSAVGCRSNVVLMAGGVGHVSSVQRPALLLGDPRRQILERPAAVTAASWDVHGT